MKFLGKKLAFALGGKKKSARPMTASIGASSQTPGFRSMQDSDAWNPDLVGVEGLRTLDRMHVSDPTVTAVMRAYMAPIMAARWEVEPASDDARAVDAADLVREQLFSLECSWEDFIEEALEHLVFGFYPFELIWEISEGQAVLRDLAPRPPVEIEEIRSDARGRFLGIEQELTEPETGDLPPGVDLGRMRGGKAGRVFIPAEKLCHVVRARRGANFAGRSILRGAYKPWWIKKELEMLAGIALERRSLGVDVMKLPPDATPDQQAEMETALMGLHNREAQFLTVPSGYEYVLEGLRGSVLDPKSMIEYCDISIARAGSAEFIAMGAGSTGSFAQHADKTSLFMQGLGSTTRAIKAAINRQVIPHIVRYNLGDLPMDELPMLTHSRLDSRNVQGIASAAVSLASSNLIGEVTDEDRNQFRALLELPELDIEAERDDDDGDPVEIPEGGEPSLPEGAVEDVQKTALNGAQVQAAQGIVQSVSDGILPRDSAIGMLMQFFRMTREQALAIMGSVGDGFEPRRPEPDPPAPPPMGDDGGRLDAAARKRAVEMPRSDFPVTQFMDADAIRDELDAYQKAIISAARKVQRKQVAEMVDEATTRWAAGQKRSIVKPTVPHLDEIAEVFTEKLVELARRGEEMVEDELRLQADAAGVSSFSIKPVNLTRQSSIDAFLAIRGDTIAAKLGDQLRSAFRFEIMPQIREGNYDSGKLARALDGLQLAEVAKAARLAISEALSMGRRTAQEAFESEGDIAFYVYSTATESNTCGACAVLEGARIEAGSPDFQKFYPPLRDGPAGPCEGADGCNCDIFAVYKTRGG